MSEEGRIVAGIGGSYEVRLPGGEVLWVKARGLFRKQKLTPLLGDKVLIERLSGPDSLLPEGEDAAEKEGAPGGKGRTVQGKIIEILPRKNEAVRPAAANIDQLWIVFAVRYPAPSLRLLDRFLIEADRRGIEVMILWNKLDLLPEAEKRAFEQMTRYYKAAGYESISLSLFEPDEHALELLRGRLKGRVTVLSGPSGVGKSTLINALLGAQEETGELSLRIERGKNTTRHARLLSVEGDGFLADTPGFSTLDMCEMQAEELPRCFREFIPYLSECRYVSCRHEKEPGCAVLQAVSGGKIPRFRYESYVSLLKEIEEKNAYS